MITTLARFGNTHLRGFVPQYPRTQQMRRRLALVTDTSKRVANDLYPWDGKCVSRSGIAHAQSSMVEIRMADFSHVTAEQV